jgi:antitoxin HigA-1
VTPPDPLAEQLEELGMSAAELARQLNVPTNRVTAILKGQRAVTGDTALRLGHFFGTSAEFWMNLQKAIRTPHRRSEIGKGRRAVADPGKIRERRTRRVANRAYLDERLHSGER